MRSGDVFAGKVIAAAIALTGLSAGIELGCARLIGRRGRA